MKKLWKGLCEVRVPRGFLDSGQTLAFVWIVTWAHDEAGYFDNARKLLAFYEGEMIDYEKVEVIDPDANHGELNELTDQARDNPNAILFGTFNAYPTQ
jgi:hypothetical protein